MNNKRNTTKEKMKENKGYPYKKGGSNRTLRKIFKKAYERIEKEKEEGEEWKNT